MVEFYDNNAMKPKVYPLDCVMRGKNCQPIIVITYDKCTFSANNKIQKAWTQEGNTFLRSKGQRQGIMVLEFILPFVRLHLASLTLEKRQKVMEKTSLTNKEVVEMFEY